VVPCLSIVEGHTVHSRHPSGGIVFQRVRSGPLEVNLLLVDTHLIEGTFNGARDRGHGSRRKREILVFLFWVRSLRFCQERWRQGNWIRRCMTTVRRSSTNLNAKLCSVWERVSGTGGVGEIRGRTRK